MAEVVVFDIDAASAIQKLAQLRADTNALKEAQKQLAVEVQKGNKDAATSYEANAIILKNLSNEQRNLSRQVEGYAEVQKKATDTTNFSNNSIQQNRDLLKQLTAQYVGLQNPTKEATDRIKSLSDTLKQQESAIGDNRRSVGSYKEAISSAFNELKVGNVQVGQLSQSISASKNAFQAAGGGVKGFSAALATTGIPIVVMAVQQLINVFSAFKPVADAVENVVNGLAAGFKALIDGNDIVETVKQSNALLETLRDLEDTQNAFNIAQAKGKNEIDRLIIASKDRTKTEEERIAALEKAEQLEKELFNNQVERNETLAVQQEKTLMQQLKLSKEELNVLATSDDANDKYYKKIKERAEANTAFDEEALKKYQDTLKERANLEGESAKFSERVVNQRNKLIEKEEEEQEKAAEKAKQRLEKLKQEREKYEQDIANLSSQFLNTDRQKLVKSFEDKLDTIKGFSKKEIELRIELLEQQQKALDEFDKKVATENQKKFIEEFLTGVEKELELLDLQQEGRREFLIQSGETELEITERFRKERQAIIDKYAQKEVEARLKNNMLALETELTNLQINGENTLEKELEIEDAKQIAILENDELTLTEKEKLIAESNLRIKQLRDADAQATLQKEQDIANARIQIASSLSSSLSSLITLFGEESAAAAAFQKTLAAFQIGVDAALAISKGVAQSQSLPFPGNIAAIATTVATVLANIAKAKQLLAATPPPPPPPQFAEGGEIEIGGKSHLQGGVQLALDGKPVAEVEQGEGLFVMKKNAYQAIKNYSNINKAFGGKTWNTTSSFLQDGGAINTTLPRQTARIKVNEQIQQNREIVRALSAMPAPELSIVELDRKTAKRNKSVRVSEL